MGKHPHNIIYTNELLLWLFLHRSQDAPQPKHAHYRSEPTVFYPLRVDSLWVLVNTRYMASIQSEVLTLQECSKYLKIAESTIYVLARNGRIPAQKVGRNWRFSKDALDRWLAGEIILKTSVEKVQNQLRILFRQVKFTHYQAQRETSFKSLFILGKQNEIRELFQPSLFTILIRIITILFFRPSICSLKRGEFSQY